MSRCFIQIQTFYTKAESGINNLRPCAKMIKNTAMIQLLQEDHHDIDKG